MLVGLLSLVGEEVLALVEVVGVLALVEELALGVGVGVLALAVVLV